MTDTPDSHPPTPPHAPASADSQPTLPADGQQQRQPSHQQHWDQPDSRSQSAASSDHDTGHSHWSSERRVPDKEQQISSPRDPPYIYTHPPPPPYHSIHHAMSHRGESMVMPQRRYDPYSKSHDLSHPSPPPIATLTNSPSLSTSSLDRSAVSSPAPNGHHHSQSTYGAPYYSHSIKQSPKPYYASAHPPPMDNAAPPPQNYTYSSQSRYEHSYRHEPMHQVPQGYGGGALPGVSHIAPGTMRNGYAPAHQLPSQSDYGIILTDDAATKLSDRVRRRCFNCCTTDTSTWRRSTLNPGKVLCNKCGLFERTHSRPRPDQFPHKRGHITSAQRARTPPQQQQLPPMAPQGQQPPPHSYSHPSIAPLFARAEWRAPPPQQKGEAPPARLRPVSPTPPSSRSESPSHAKNAFSEQAHDRPA